MKNIIILSFLTVVAVSCSEEETKDPLIGDWQFTLSGFQGEFTITSDPDYQYKVDAISVDGEPWTRSTVDGAEKRKIITSFLISNNASDLTIKVFRFYGCRASDGIIHVDSVYFGEVIDREVVHTAFYNQSLTRAQ